MALKKRDPPQSLPRSRLRANFPTVVAVLTKVFEAGWLKIHRAGAVSAAQVQAAAATPDLADVRT